MLVATSTRHRRSTMTLDADTPELLRLADLDISTQIARLVPEEVARRHLLVPIRLHDGSLEVAMQTPHDLDAIEEVRNLTGMPVRSVAANPHEIEEVIRQSFGLEHEARQTVVDLRMENMRLAPEEEAESGDADVHDETAAPVVRLLSSILGGAIEGRASDIHLDPQRAETIVRFRTDGVLHQVMTIPSHVQQAAVSRIKLLANLDIAERRRPQDGHLYHTHRERKVDLRVSTLLGTSGEKIVMRVLDETSQTLDLGDLGLIGQDREDVEHLLAMPFGMFLITGPTGSGKTTTLYSLLNRLEPQTSSVITLEDPVEYQLAHVHQVQVGVPQELTFARGLRTILRQDPDVIMVGEIRDHETAEIAIQSAQTGHLLLSTLHTNDAASALTRLVEMGVPPYMVTSALGGVVAQRLVRTICPDCAESRAANPEELEFMGERAGDLDTVSEGRGCSFCRNTGYRGRAGIYEILRVTEAIAGALVGGARASEIAQLAVADGMRTLARSATTSITSGKTTVREIKRVLGAMAKA